ALMRHLLITVLAIFFACILAIPLGIFLAKTSQNWIRSIIFTITNIFQTVPSLAMLAIFIPIIGIGLKPAIIALFLYSLLPILRNTYAAFKSIDEGIVESAKGMGYSSLQRLFQIEILIAIPYLMSVIRLTTFYMSYGATLAASICADVLVLLIIVRMCVYYQPLFFAAAILDMLLALATELLLARVENLSSQKTTFKSSDKNEESA